MDYPLALTHIKLTGAFLDLLSKGKVKVDSWSNAQKGYNCLVVGMFKKIMSSFKSGDTMGSLVEDTARELKGEYGRLMRSYEAEFKDSK